MRQQSLTVVMGFCLGFSVEQQNRLLFTRYFCARDMRFDKTKSNFEATINIMKFNMIDVSLKFEITINECRSHLNRIYSLIFCQKKQQITPIRIYILVFENAAFHTPMQETAFPAVDVFIISTQSIPFRAIIDVDWVWVGKKRQSMLA